MRVSVAAVALPGSITTAGAEEAAYAAIYYQGSEQIVLNAQATPIPIPQAGAVIEVNDQGRQLGGYVRRVSHEVQRTPGPIPFRFFVVKVEISPTPLMRATARLARR